MLRNGTHDKMFHMAYVECKLKDDLENWNTESDVVYHNSDDIEYKALEILIYILANNPSATFNS